MLEGKCTPNFGQYISKNHGVNGGMHEKIQALVLLILLLPLQNGIRRCWRNVSCPTNKGHSGRCETPACAGSHYVWAEPAYFLSFDGSFYEA